MVDASDAADRLPCQPSAAGSSLLAAAVEELRGRPLAVAVALFAVGIWAGARYEVAPRWALGALGAASVVAVALALRRSRAAAMMVLLVAGFAGGFAYSLSQVKAAGDVCTFARSTRTIEGVVVSEPHRSGASQSMAVEVRSCVNAATGVRSPARGRVWLTCISPAPLERGDLVRFTSIIYPPREATNPGEITRRGAVAAAGMTALAYVREPRLLERLGGARLDLLESAGIAFREHVARVMRDTMPGPYRDALGALLGSIVFGAKAHPLPPEVMDAFRGAGVVHVLVVSGSQISLLFLIVYAPGVVAAYLRRRRYGAPAGAHGRLAPLPAYATLGLVLVLIGVYALFTEGGRPVARAAIMGAVVAIGLMLRQAARVADEHALEFDRYTIIAIAALALLVVHPEGLFDIGLQLSLGAVLGLAYLAPKIMPWLRPLPRWAAVIIAATVSAQLAVLPIMAGSFRYISPVGFVANLFVIPLTGLLLISGIAVCVLGSISAPLATAVNHVNAPLLRGAVRFAYLAAHLPYASFEVSPLSPLAAIGYYAALVALAALLDRWWRRRRATEELPPP